MLFRWKFIWSCWCNVTSLVYCAVVFKWVSTDHECRTSTLQNVSIHAIDTRAHYFNSKYVLATSRVLTAEKFSYMHVLCVDFRAFCAKGDKNLPEILLNCTAVTVALDSWTSLPSGCPLLSSCPISKSKNLCIIIIQLLSRCWLYMTCACTLCTCALCFGISVHCVSAYSV